MVSYNELAAKYGAEAAQAAIKTAASSSSKTSTSGATATDSSKSGSAGSSSGSNSGTYTYNKDTGYYEQTGGSSSSSRLSDSSVTSGGKVYTDADGYTSATARNAATAGSEFGKQTTTKTTTKTDTTSGTVSEQPKTSGTTQAQWDKYTYEQQQAMLSKSPDLQDYLTSKGVSNKTKPVETVTEDKTPEKTGEWDYQDNSADRMDEIVGNLNKYKVSNPELFTDYDTFKKFFIDGTNRSQEQIDTINSRWEQNSKWKNYVTMSPQEIGYGVANGTFNDKSYLTYLAETNPEMFSQIQAAAEERKNQIKNQATQASDTSMMTGDESSLDAFLKKFGIEDKDGDGKYDTETISKSDEQLELEKSASEMSSQIISLQRQKRKVLDDLIEQYPGVALSTLTVMAADMSEDLTNEIADLSIELNSITGQISSLESDRKSQIQQQQQLISNLQSLYGMYYKYTPEGMAEYASMSAQAEYAATNITLDQADTGTITQKQMALESVLTPYYEKYGSIINRSPAEVINDVINYANTHGVSLNQAFQENFVKQLQSKPAYASLSNGGGQGSVTRGVVGEDDEGHKIYGFIDTTNKTISPYGGTVGTGTSGGGQGTYTEESVNNNRGTRQSYMTEVGNSYSGDDKAEGIASAMEGLGGGKLECGVYTNDYIYSVTGEKGKFGNEVSQKISLCDNKDDINSVKVGDAIVFDWSKSEPAWVKNSDRRDELLEYGHVGFVTAIDGDNITISHTSGGKVTTTTFNKNDGNDYARNFAGSMTVTPKEGGVSTYNSSIPDSVYTSFLNESVTSRKEATAKQYGVSVSQMNAWADAYAKKRDGEALKGVLTTIDKLISGGIPNDYGRWSLSDEGWGITKTITTLSNKEVKDWVSDFNYVYNTLGMDKFLDLKSKGATFGALSDSERQAIYSAASTLDLNNSSEKIIQDLIDIRNTIISNSGWYLDTYKNSAVNDNYDWMSTF